MIYLYIPINILGKADDRRLVIRSEFSERMMLMSTYEEFMVLLTIVLVVIAVLDLKNKK